MGIEPRENVPGDMDSTLREKGTLEQPQEQIDPAAVLELPLISGNHYRTFWKFLCLYLYLGS